MKSMSRLKRVFPILPLALALWLAVGMARAGEGSIEIPIPAEVEQGLARAGIRLEAERSWTQEPSVWIAGAIVVAGFAIAYAIYRRKA